MRVSVNEREVKKDTKAEQKERRHHDLEKPRQRYRDSQTAREALGKAE